MKTIYLLLLLGVSTPALAQQTGNNAVTQSEDAFGRAVGNERIGIYSNEEVRGFNPIEAGNNRLDGLYIDLGNIASPRLIAGSAIRVGYAANGTPFPAPTGIVDLQMEKFAGTRRISLEAEVETNPNFAGAIETQIPLVGERFGMALGVGFREADQVGGRNGSFVNYLASISWLPEKNSEINLFSGGFKGKGAEHATLHFPAGDALPPRQSRALQQTQPWAQNRNRGSVSGAIVKIPLGTFRLEAGLFHTTRAEPNLFATLQLGIEPTGFVRNSVVLADVGNYIHSNSGEIRLSRSYISGKVRHSFTASLRGRDQSRAFGGQQSISLGNSLLGIQDFRPKPQLSFGPNDKSHVRQFTFGLQYGLQTTSGNILNLAVQKADYRKHNNFASPGLRDTDTRAKPWLFSGTGAWAVLPRLKLYGGYVRGLEESALAPDIATNRSEAPPALRTRQMDAGLRFAVQPKLALIAGVFEIKKPYFGVDSNLRFANLGTVANRGAELSLAGTLGKGLTIVAGGILIDPKISGPEVAAGRIGPRPIGSSRSHGIFNLDWKPEGQDAWSFDLALDGNSSEMANRLNSFSTSGRININLGLRYRFAVGKGKFLLRGQVLNLFNSYDWRVNSSGGFTYTLPRNFTLHLIADF